MTNPAWRIVPAIALGVSLCTAQALAGGLEGGLTTDSHHWSGAHVPTPLPPTPEQRKAELAQRKKDIAAEIASLKARLKRAPDEATQQRLEAKLAQIRKNYGWVPELNLVIGLRDMEPVEKGIEKLDPGLLAGFAQLKKDLDRRGIDLIVMPFPANAFVYTHLLVDGADAETEVYPGYTKMLLEFLDNDIEIVDVLDEFRAQAHSDVDVVWPNDTHTGSLGRKIAAELLAKRLQRYDFARQAAPRAKEITYKVEQQTGARWGWSVYYKNGGLDRKGNTYTVHPGAPDISQKMLRRPMKLLRIQWPDGHSKKYAPRGRPNIARDGTWDLVLIGDSQLHSAVHGDGLPAYVFSELGAVCRWGSRSWSGFSAPQIYLETATNVARNQPRVVVAMFLFFKLPHEGKSHYHPKPLPKLAESADDTAVTAKPFNARVKILEVSKPRDPRKLDYQEALMVALAEVLEGPMKGKKVRLLHWGMIGGRILKPVPKLPHLVGETHNMQLTPWSLAKKNDSKLGTHQQFDDTSLAEEFEVPTFWVTRGKLDPKHMKSR